MEKAGARKAIEFHLFAIYIFAMSRIELLQKLKNYSLKYPSESQTVDKIIKFVEDNEDCFERTNLRGHITSSAWIQHPTEDKYLLTHHRKLRMWMQLGGHNDGDTKTENVSLKEAQEESGIQNFDFIDNEIFDVDVHEIPENPKDKAHLHFDIRFFLKAKDKNFEVSEESIDLAWLKPDEIKKYSQEESILRMLKKTANY